MGFADEYILKHDDKNMNDFEFSEEWLYNLRDIQKLSERKRTSDLIRKRIRYGVNRNLVIL